MVNDIERSEQVSRPCPRSDATVDLPGTDTNPDEGDLHLAHLAGGPQNSTVRPVGPDLQLGGEVGPEIVGAPESYPNSAAIRLPAAREPRETLVGGGHPRVETFPERMLVVTQVVVATIPEPSDESTALFVGLELFPTFQLFAEEQIADRAVGPFLDVSLKDGHRLRRIGGHLGARRGTS